MPGVELATAYVSIVPDTSGLGRQLVSQGSPHMSSAGSSMGAMLGGKLVAALAAAGIGAAIVSQVKLGIDGAIAQAESLNKVDVVFGAASDSVKTFAAQGAKALGMSQGSALEYAGTLGNLLTATGLTDEAAAAMSTTMVGLSADLGSFNNTSPEDALEALRSGLAGETEPLKRFGVNLNEAILKQKALELGIGDGKAALDPAARAQAAYAVIMEQTTKAQGDFARTSDGVANKQRIAAAQWEDIRNRIGNGFLPIISKVQDVIIKVLDTIGSGGGLAGLFPPEIQAQIATFKDALSELGVTVMPTIRQWYDDIIKPAMEKIGAAFKDVALEVIPTITAIVDFVRENWPVIQKVIEPVMTAIVNIISGIMQVIAGVVRTVMAVVRGDWDAAWEGIKTVFSGIVDIIKGSSIGMAIETAFENAKKVGAWFTDMKDQVVRVLKDLLDKIKKPLGDIRQAIKDALDPFQRHSPSLVDNVLRGVGVISGAYGSLSGMSIAGPSIGGISAGYGSLTPALASGTTVINYNAPVRTYSETIQANRDIQRGLYQ